jgi:hypothetical protein
MRATSLVSEDNSQFLEEHFNIGSEYANVIFSITGKANGMRHVIHIFHMHSTSQEGSWVNAMLVFIMFSTTTKI